VPCFFFFFCKPNATYPKPLPTLQTRSSTSTSNVKITQTILHRFILELIDSNTPLLRFYTSVSRSNQSYTFSLSPMACFSFPRSGPDNPEPRLQLYTRRDETRRTRTIGRGVSAIPRDTRARKGGGGFIMALFPDLF